VATDGPKLVAADVFTTQFQAVDPDMTPSIRRAELKLDNGIVFAIDDLEFDRYTDFHLLTGELALRRLAPHLVRRHRHRSPHPVVRPGPARG
jgi:hypothetical protein